MSSDFEGNNLLNSSSKTLTTLEKAEKNVYCISGLGADERVFYQLKFKGYKPVHINWLAPHKRENISDYAKRLAAEIEGDEPILIGLSFGGIIAIEIARHIAVKKLILISSVRQKQEIPFYFRWFRWLPIHLIIPFKSLLWAVYWLINWFFSLENFEERKLLRAILKDTDARFLKWAINCVVTWDNQTIPDNIYQLHGTSDRIFPIKFVRPDVTLEKGGHFMIMNRANKISQLIDSIIKES